MGEDLRLSLLHPAAAPQDEASGRSPGRELSAIQGRVWPFKGHFHRQLDDESCTLTLRTFDPNLASMGFDDPLAQA